MIAAYVRVSSRAQDVQSQRSAILKGSLARKDRIVAWYVETASSVKQRPELERLRGDVRSGKVSKVYVYRLDRFSRVGIVETVTLVKEMQACGCEIVTLADGFSLQGPAAEVIVAVFGWAAQMERLAINERIAAARQSTDEWGRPRRVNDILAARIRKLHRQGKTIREIAVAVKIKRSTVSDVVSEKGVYHRTVAKASKTVLSKVAASLSE